VDGIEQRFGIGTGRVCLYERGVFTGLGLDPCGVYRETAGLEGRSCRLPIETEVVDARNLSVQVKKQRFAGGAAEFSYTLLRIVTGDYCHNVIFCATEARHAARFDRALVKEFLPYRINCSPLGTQRWRGPKDIQASFRCAIFTAPPATNADRQPSAACRGRFPVR